MSYEYNSFVVVSEIQSLSVEELECVAAGVTASQLRDASGALTSIGVAAALLGAEPVAAAAFAGAATAVEIASLMDVFS